MRDLPNLGDKNKEPPLCYPYSIKARALIHAHLSRLELPRLTLKSGAKSGFCFFFVFWLLHNKTNKLASFSVGLSMHWKCFPLFDCVKVGKRSKMGGEGGEFFVPTFCSTEKRDKFIVSKVWKEPLKCWLHRLVVSVIGGITFDFTIFLLQ